MAHAMAEPGLRTVACPEGNNLRKGRVCDVVIVVLFSKRIRDCHPDRAVNAAVSACARALGERGFEIAGFFVCFFADKMADFVTIPEYRRNGPGRDVIHEFFSGMLGEQFAYFFT